MSLDEMRQEVFRQKKTFGSIVEAWGDRTWVDYYTQDFKNLGESSGAVLDAIEAETARILGVRVGKAARLSVAENKWTNTADHHGLLCHPYFFSTALARSHASVRKASNAVVTLPFGGVSLSNDSFPRGFFFHDREGEEVRIHFKSLKERRMPVYASLPMKKSDLILDRDRALSFSLSLSAQERLNALFTAFLADDRVWTCDTYSEQLTLLTSILWHELFSSGRGDFVYLEIDTVVRRLLLQKHLVQETFIFSLIFNVEWRTAFVELFSGVMGSHTPETGTHLFWHIDHTQKTRRSLFIHGGTLVTREGDVSFPLTPEHIAKGLENRTLMPSSALLLIVIQGVEGLAAGGGPSQLEYLGSFMGAWEKLLQRFGHTVSLPTASILCGDTALFQMHHGKDTFCGLASLIDIFLYEKDIQGRIDDALATTPIKDTADALMPRLYEMYTRNKVAVAPA